MARERLASDRLRGFGPLLPLLCAHPRDTRANSYRLERRTAKGLYGVLAAELRSP